MIIPNVWENKIDGNQTTNQYIKGHQSFNMPFREYWPPQNGPDQKKHHLGDKTTHLGT